MVQDELEARATLGARVIFLSDPGCPPLLAELPELLGAIAMPVDEIARRCQFSSAALAAALMELELEGRIETLPDNRVGLITGT